MKTINKNKNHQWGLWLLLLILFISLGYIVWGLVSEPVAEENAQNPDWEAINEEFATNQVATFQAIQSTSLPTSTQPMINKVEFPSRIPGNGEIYHGDLHFHDPDGDVSRIVLDVISATNIENIGYNPGLDLISGDYITGTYQLTIWCKGQQSVTMQATLYDQSRFRSNSVAFSFICE
jgi:hypothetical protein